jgi:protocatechuate 3,4-dioxygenase beta subunit
MASPTREALPTRPSSTTLPQSTTTPTEEPPGASAVPVVALDTRFAPQNEAVDYGPWPEGCDGTYLVGRVLDADGVGVPGLRIRIWDVASGAATVVSTDADGAYQVHIAEGLTDAVLNVQLLDANGMTVLSDVVHAPALPDCGLNQMTITFVPTP